MPERARPRFKVTPGPNTAGPDWAVSEIRTCGLTAIVHAPEGRNGGSEKEAMRLRVGRYVTSELCDADSEARSDTPGASTAAVTR
jgi:hypothetical protein